MKSIIFRIRIFLIALIISSSVNGQKCCPYMNSISIQPTNPKIDDYIKIMTQVTTPSLGKKISKYYYLKNDTIFLEGCYYAGLFTQPQIFLDTFDIGLMNIGKYTIYFTAYQSYDSNSCKYVKFNTKNDSLSVGKTGTILLKKKLSVNIYPNPANESVNIQLTKSNYKNYTIKIFDNNGRLKDEIYCSKDFTYKTNLLKNGLYLFVISIDNFQYTETHKLLIDK